MTTFKEFEDKKQEIGMLAGKITKFKIDDIVKVIGVNNPFYSQGDIGRVFEIGRRVVVIHIQLKFLDFAVAT